MTADHTHAMGIAQNQRGEVVMTDYMHQLTTGGGKPGEGYPAVLVAPLQDGRDMEKHQNGLGVGQVGDPSYTLDQTGAQGVIAFSAGNSAAARSIAVTVDATPPLRASESGTNQVPTIAFHPTQDPISGPVSPALGTTSGGMGVAYSVEVTAPTLTASNNPSRSPQSTEVTQQVAAVHAAQMAVRRLTPLECERLMAFPDDHTRWRADGTEQSDSARYKQCGNGVVANVAEWIGRHILAAMSVSSDGSCPPPSETRD